MPYGRKLARSVINKIKNSKIDNKEGFIKKIRYYSTLPIEVIPKEDNEHLKIYNSLKKKSIPIIKSKEYIEYLSLVNKGDVDRIWNHFNKYQLGNQLNNEEMINLMKLINKGTPENRVSRILELTKLIKLNSTINIIHYEQLMHSLASTKRFEESRILLKEITQNKIKLSDRILITLINFLGYEGKTLTSIKLLKSFSNNLSLYSEQVKYSILLAFINRKDVSNLNLFFEQFKVDLPINLLRKVFAFYIEQKRVEDAYQLFVKYKQSQHFILDENIYLKMVQGYLKQDDFINAKQIYNEFIQLGGIPSIQFTSQMIDLSLKQKCIDGIQERLISISDKDLRLVHAEYFVVYLLLKYQDLNYDYFLLLDKIQQYRISTKLKTLANKILLKTLINYLCKNKKWDLAEQQINLLADKNIYSIKAYHQLMKAFVFNGQQQRGLKLLKQFKQSNIEFNSYTFEIGFKLLTKVLDLETTLDLYNYSKTCNTNLTLNSIQYIMHILNIKKEHNLLVEIFLDILEMETYPTTDLINILVKEYLLNEQYDQILEFYQHLYNQGITPQLSNFSYLINRLLEVEQNLEIENGINLMIKFKVKGDLKLYTNIIQYYFKKQDLNKVQFVLDLIQQNNMIPDKVLYAVLTRGFVKLEKLGLVRQLFLNIEKQNIKLDVVNYSCLIGKHMIKNGLEDAFKFLDTLNTLNVELDGPLHSILMENILIHLGPSALIKYFNDRQNEVNKFNEPFILVCKEANNNALLFEFLKELFVKYHDKFKGDLLDSYALCCVGNKNSKEVKKLVDCYPHLIDLKPVQVFIDKFGL